MNDACARFCYESKERFELRNGPSHIRLVRRVFPPLATGRPTIQNWHSIKSKIARELSGSTGCVLEGSIVAMHKNERFSAFRALQPLLQLGEEVLFFLCLHI